MREEGLKLQPKAAEGGCSTGRIMGAHRCSHVPRAAGHGDIPGEPAEPVTELGTGKRAGRSVLQNRNPTVAVYMTH